MNFSFVSNSLIDSYVDLFTESFPQARHLSAEYLKWLYYHNPAGEVVGFDCMDNGQVVAHYVCIPVEYSIGNRKRLGLLSLNTATRPSHQGRGLFSKLAEMTYERAKTLGYEYVIGVSNSNSTPGFLKRLSFELISPLDVFLTINHSQHINSTREIYFERHWSHEALSWRLKNPTTDYRRINDRIVSPSSIPGLSIVSSSLTASTGGLDSVKKSLGFFPSIFLGFDDTRKVGIPVPSFLKPSPLNFIFRQLAGEKISLKKEDMRFDFLDFDAY